MFKRQKISPRGVKKRANGATIQPAKRQRVSGAAPAARNRRVGGYVGIEKKFIDAHKTETALAATWTSVQPSSGVTDCISCPAQGDGESNRDGRVYYIHSIYVHGKVIKPAQESAAAPTGTQRVRVAMVLDKQTNAAGVTATNVMDNTASDQIMAFRNLQLVSRFQVLKQKTMYINPEIVNEGAVNLFANGVREIPFNFSYKFKTPLKVVCVGTTADVASVTDNSISIIAVANSTSDTIQYDTRCRFTG